ncbi:MAG TPA: c-type cytochrome, partial [Burkholderiales bacterium]|nr:c-type cytochrome [Burkholderiales bacterium]
MRHVVRWTVSACTIAAASICAFAQSPSKPPAAPPAAAQCAGCHGAQGEGNSAANFPRIAGQPQYYLAKQLTDYANGRRRNAVMEPIAKGLAAADRDAIAAYYSQMAPTAPAATAQNTAGSGGRANELSRAGDARLGVQACNNCHGPDGSGEPPVFPYLAGLDAKYLHAA